MARPAARIGTASEIQAAAPCAPISSIALLCGSRGAHLDDGARVCRTETRGGAGMRNARVAATPLRFAAPLVSHFVAAENQQQPGGKKNRVQPDVSTETELVGIPQAFSVARPQRVGHDGGALNRGRWQSASPRLRREAPRGPDFHQRGRLFARPRPPEQREVRTRRNPSGWFRTSLRHRMHVEPDERFPRCRTPLISKCSR